MLPFHSEMNEYERIDASTANSNAQVLGPGDTTEWESPIEELHVILLYQLFMKNGWIRTPRVRGTTTREQHNSSWETANEMAIEVKLVINQCNRDIGARPRLSKLSTPCARPNTCEAATVPAHQAQREMPNDIPLSLSFRETAVMQARRVERDRAHGPGNRENSGHCCDRLLHRFPVGVEINYHCFTSWQCGSAPRFAELRFTHTGNRCSG